MGVNVRLYMESDNSGKVVPPDHTFNGHDKYYRRKLVSKDEARFHAYGLILQDLEFSRFAFGRCVEVDQMSAQGMESFAYWMSATVSYVKCFNKSEGRKIRLSKRNHVPEKFHGHHDEAVRLRNEYMAHDGHHSYNRGVACVMFDMNGDVIDAAMYKSLAVGAHPDEMAPFRDMVGEVIAKVEGIRDMERVRIVEKYQKMDVKQRLEGVNLVDLTQE